MTPGSTPLIPGVSSLLPHTWHLAMTLSVHLFSITEVYLCTLAATSNLYLWNIKTATVRFFTEDLHKFRQRHIVNNVTTLCHIRNGQWNEVTPYYMDIASRNSDLVSCSWYLISISYQWPQTCKLFSCYVLNSTYLFDGPRLLIARCPVCVRSTATGDHHLPPT